MVCAKLYAATKLFVDMNLDKNDSGLVVSSNAGKLDHYLCMKLVLWLNGCVYKCKELLKTLLN